MTQKLDFQSFAEKWPSPIVARTEAGKFTGGLIHPRTLANLDSQGLGPSGRFKVGRKTAYPVNSFIDWLKKRAEKIG